jgi:hypothetical protein
MYARAAADLTKGLGDDERLDVVSLSATNSLNESQRAQEIR